MADEPVTRSQATRQNKRSDEYHVYVRHDDVSYFLAADGTFVPDLGMATGFEDIEDAHDALNRMIDGRELGKDEPGIVRNAWRWIGEGR